MSNRCISTLAGRLTIAILAVLAIYFLVALLFRLAPWSSGGPPAW